MSSTAIFDTAQALRARIGLAVGGPGEIHIGPPLKEEVGTAKVSLFAFHLQANAELRNELRFASPPALEPATEIAQRVDALPLDIRFLITVFRNPTATVVPPNELTTLGEIVEILQARPTLTGESLGAQVVRVTPEPYPMEELSRVWGLFPQDTYRTSMVYLASPVFVEARAFPAGPAVQSRTQATGLSTDQPDISGRKRDQLDREGIE